jgi:hypothetical protein
MNFHQSIVLAAVLLWWPCLGQAQPNKEIYELQERCGRRAEEVFNREYGRSVQTEHGQIIFDYESHYSPRLNRCFFLEIAVTYEVSNGKRDSTRILRLFDMNDKKEYGFYIVNLDGTGAVMCAVRDKVCQSEAEWRELIKPFMED